MLEYSSEETVSTHLPTPLLPLILAVESGTGLLQRVMNVRSIGISMLMDAALKLILIVVAMMLRTVSA
jgi:hypothetical protein